MEQAGSEGNTAISRYLNMTILVKEEIKRQRKIHLRKFYQPYGYFILKCLLSALCAFEVLTNLAFSYANYSIHSHRLINIDGQAVISTLPEKPIYTMSLFQQQQKSKVPDSPNDTECFVKSFISLSNLGSICSILALKQVFENYTHF